MYAIKRFDNTVQIEGLLQISHNRKCVADLVPMIYLIRKAAV